MALVQALSVSLTDRPHPSLDFVQQRRPLSRSPPSSSSGGPRGPGTAMGSVSSLVTGRAYQERHCRAASEFGAKARRAAATAAAPATGCFRLPDDGLRSAGSSLEQLLVVGDDGQNRASAPLRPPPLPAKRQPRAGNAAGGGGHGNCGFAADEPAAVLASSAGDWEDKPLPHPGSPCSDGEEQREHPPPGLNGNIAGPPPKLIPVSGKLEKNMEKILIRPTAFKPVVPKNRHSVQYLAPRPGGVLSESQGSFNLLLPLGVANGNGANGSDSQRNSYSGGRHARSSQSGSMSDSGRNSLSSLPTHSSAGYSLAHSEGGSSSGSGSGGPAAAGPPSEPGAGRTAAAGGGGVGAGVGGTSGSHTARHGHTNSDSGRSSSGKSTGSGSLGRHGRPLSDSGSCGRSPPPPPPPPQEGYEAAVRELEAKLKERDLELQQLRENLDENEAAICQVYEEKLRRCEREMDELRQSCSSGMKQAALKGQRAQQGLQLQVFQLQQEKKKLQEDFSSVLREREALERRCASVEREQTQLGPRLEESEWEVCQKSGEISLLKQQLKELRAELSQKAGDAVVLKAQLREARAELQAGHARSHEAQAAVRTRALELEACESELRRRRGEAEVLRERAAGLEEESARLREALSRHGGGRTFAAGGGRGGGAAGGAGKGGQCMSLPLPPGRGGPRGDAGEEEEGRVAAWGGESDEAKARRQGAEAAMRLRQQVERLKAELLYERRSSEEQMSGFEGERRVWQEEKEKVIRYQKQLQQNYIHMYRRNRDLERVTRELSAELENRGEPEEEEEEEDYEVRSGSNDIHYEEITATEI